MSLVHIVTVLVSKRGRASADSLMAEPDCEGYRRQQIVAALRNAAHFGHVHCVDRVASSRASNARIGVYESGPAPRKEVKKPKRALPANSVWQMGERAAA